MCFLLGLGVVLPWPEFSVSGFVPEQMSVFLLIILQCGLILAGSAVHGRTFFTVRTFESFGWNLCHPIVNKNVFVL